MSKHTGINTDTASEADAAADFSAYGAEAEDLFIAEVAGEEIVESAENTAADADSDEEDADAVDTNADDGAEAGESEDADEDDSAEDEEEADADEDEDGEDEADEDTEDDEEEAADDGKIPAKYQSHVAKLLKKTRDKERAKAAEVRAKLDKMQEDYGAVNAARDNAEEKLRQLTAQKLVPVPTEDSPFANVLDVKALEKEEARLWEFRRKLMEDPTSVKVPDPDNPGESRYLDDDEARKYLAFVDERLQRALPKRKEWLRQHEQLDAVLTKYFPEVDKAGSEVQRRVDAVIAEFPQVKLLPGYRNVALAQSVGRELLARYGVNAMKVLQAAGQPGEKASASKPELKHKPKPKVSDPKSMKVKPQKKQPALKSTGRVVSEEEFADMVASNFVR